MKAVTQAVSDGTLQFGYTNPFTSATGLNFLIFTLVRYDTSNPLSDVATEGFRSFQRNVPFVSLTTQQMHDAAQRDTLDGFVTEYQVYHNDQQLQGAYKFAAFGYRHDNPLVAVSGASDDAKAVLDAFAQYCARDSSQQLASEDGFNGLDDYVSESAGDVQGELVCLGLLHHGIAGGESACKIISRDFVDADLDGSGSKDIFQSLRLLLHFRCHEQCHLFGSLQQYGQDIGYRLT